jgi:hypothetical protein
MSGHVELKLTCCLSAKRARAGYTLRGWKHRAFASRRFTAGALMPECGSVSSLAFRKRSLCVLIISPKDPRKRKSESRIRNVDFETDPLFAGFITAAAPTGGFDASKRPRCPKSLGSRGVYVLRVATHVAVHVFECKQMSDRRRAFVLPATTSVHCILTPRLGRMRLLVYARTALSSQSAGLGCDQFIDDDEVTPVCV